MKFSTPVLALMSALALGSAVAQTAPTPNTTSTPVNTQIKNTANASFDIPGVDTNGNPITTPGTATSNEVTTTVLALPSFDIVYLDGTADGNTLANTPKATTNAVPGQVQTTDYYVVNNGNTPLTVLIDANTTGSATGLTVKYLDASGNELPKDSATGKYIVTLPAGSSGLVQIKQEITLPTNAPVNTVYGASPEGSVTGTGTSSGQNGIPSGQTLYENQTVTTSGGTTTINTTPAQGADLQFVKITTFQPALDATPNNPGATNPVAPDGTTAATLPALSNLPIPNVAAGTPNDPTPTNPVSAYPSTPSNPNDPTSGGTPIVPNLAGDVQIAYPKADADNTVTDPAGQTNSNPGTADAIIFTNTVSNSGTVGDKVQLFPAGPDGQLLAGTTFDAVTGVFTLPDGTTVRFLDPNTGAVIPVGTGGTYPTITVPSGSTGVFRTEITFPDTNDQALINPITVVVGADSLNDAGIVADTTTTNKIYAPAAQFGDTTAGTVGAVPAPAPFQQVVPGSNTAANIDTANSADNVAVFPMDIANLGQYNDSYTLSATVPGLPAGATITYVDASGNPLPTNGAGNFITPVIGVNDELKVFVVITVPTGTPFGDYKVQQTAVGNYSGITMTDLNNVIQVGATGNVRVAKFVQDGTTVAGTTPQNTIDNPAGYTSSTTTTLPGKDIVYRIIAKNDYNSTVKQFTLNDQVPDNTTFKTATLTVNGAAVSKTIYKVGTGAWSATVPPAGTASLTQLYFAADANNDNVPDDLPAGSTMELTMTVTVK